MAEVPNAAERSDARGGRRWRWWLLGAAYVAVVVVMALRSMPNALQRSQDLEAYQEELTADMLRVKSGWEGPLPLAVAGLAWRRDPDAVRAEAASSGRPWASLVVAERNQARWLGGELGSRPEAVAALRPLVRAVVLLDEDEAVGAGEGPTPRLELHAPDGRVVAVWTPDDGFERLTEPPWTAAADAGP